MKEDFIQTKVRTSKINFFNTKTILGLIFFVLAVWVLVGMKVFTPLVIYLIGFSLAVLGLAFLLSGVKVEQSAKLPPKLD